MSDSDSNNEFAAASANYESSIALDPSEARAMRGLASLYRLRAEWSAAHHRAVDADVCAGLEQASRALAINAALGFDGNLEREARPLFDEATRLMTR
ncbi:MAG: hypothetical protein LC659_03280 [Myxococcales bacterium]|nr:hypothetical protein [Myxococcales bacterium]